jgi:hypothetical protein
MIRNSLKRFEALAQHLVESAFPRLFGKQIDALTLAAEIGATLEKEQRDGFAPDSFRIHLPSSDHGALLPAWPAVRQQLLAALPTLSQDLGLVLAGEPEITLHPLPAENRAALLVEAFHRHPPAEEHTQPFEPLQAYDPLPALNRRDAFLIVAGKEHVVLDRPILTVGRSAECDIVLDDRRVSRRHARLHWRFDRFILTDLGSRGGTFVNNLAVEECVLQPNDVIRVGETTLLYAEGGLQEEARGPQEGDTALLGRSPDEMDTRPLPRRPDSP